MVTTTGLHDLVAVRLTLDAGESTEIEDLATLVLGDDDSSFATSDTSLNNKIGEISITDPSASGATFEVNEFLSSNELNGETIRELGIESESGTLLTHAPTPSALSKDQTKAYLFNVEITMSDS
jgi:hypothetical protein